MKSNELRDLPLQELEKKEQEIAEELFNLKIRHSLNHLDNPLTIRARRKELARIKTLLTERQQEQQGSEG
ncbi:MAG: 50S ribosomal protein L29 [bacterium]|nr:50S ribosomal protein L29 [bacterium]